MELYAYLASTLPEKHCLLKRTDSSLALIRDRTTIPLIGFDIYLRQNVVIAPGWLDVEFKVDKELEDLIIDLNVAGFRTAGCCRGKMYDDEASHLNAAYVSFSEYLSDDLLAACKNAGLHCINVDAAALRQCPTPNFRTRIDSWIRDGSRAPTPLTSEQIRLNAAFPALVREVWGSRLPSCSTMVRQQADAAVRISD